MGTTALFIAFTALNAVSTFAQNAAIDDQSANVAESANRQIAELDRQRKEASLIAQEKKADRVREADKVTASIIASLSEVGGAGTANESRFVQEAGFYEGLDLARIEGNRRREVESLRAEQQAVRSRGLNIIQRNRSRQQSNLFGFLTDTASAGFTAFGGGQAVSKAKQTGTAKGP